MSVQCVDTIHTNETGIISRFSSYAGAALAKLTAYFAARKQRRTDREAFRTMLRLDDHMLSDIGLSKADVIWASNLPLSVNASAELEIIARQNRRR